MATMDEAAVHLNIGVRTLQKHVAAGVITRRERGVYDLDEVRREYILHLRRRADENARDGASEARADAVARKHLATAARVEFDIERMRQDLLPRAEVIAGMEASQERVRQVVGELPAAAAARLSGVKDPTEIQKILTEEVHATLHRLASTTVVSGAF